jgi:hypothetical protein
MELRLETEMDRAERAKAQSGAAIAVAWLEHPDRLGDPGAGMAVVDGATFVQLLRDAGYIPAQPAAESA